MEGNAPYYRISLEAFLRESEKYILTSEDIKRLSKIKEAYEAEERRERKGS
jgi:hypothetical protein